MTIEGIQAAIPADTALLEFAVYRRFNPKAATNSEAHGEHRYAAFVIKTDGVPRAFDLGAAVTLDASVDALRQALRDPKRGDVETLARTVDGRVLAPLREAAGPVSRLLISPDGALNLIPFEALVDREGKYAIERYAITYLTSGRDLLRSSTSRRMASS